MAEQALNTEVTQPVETSTPVDTDTGGSGRTAEPSSRREASRRAARGDAMANAIGKAAKDANAKVSRGTVAPGEAPPAEEAPKAWEAPGYAKAWSEQRRKALEAIATREDLKDHWKELDGQLNDFNQWDSRRNWEIGQYRKRLEPVNEILQQMEQSYTRQGMSIQQGLGQLWQTAQDLATQPDETMARISTMVRPRNPSQVLQFLAQTWGQNLNELVQSQPYVDPHIAKQLHETQTALQRVTQENWARDQAARQQQYQALVRHIEDFEQAKDGNGNPKHPYAAEVGQDMGLLLQTGRAQSLEQAYEIATKLHPKAQEERQKAAEKAAREAAARNTTDAEQARNAARSISSKANGSRQNGRADMREAILAAERQTYGKTR